MTALSGHFKGNAEITAKFSDGMYCADASERVSRNPGSV